MIFPLVCHPRKLGSAQILDQSQSELKRKVSQGQSAGEIDPAEKSASDKFASPGDKPGHDEAPQDRTTQKACKKDRKVFWLRAA